MIEQIGEFHWGWNAKVRGRCALDVDTRARLRVERVICCLLHGEVKNSRTIQMTRVGQIDVEQGKLKVDSCPLKHYFAATHFIKSMVAPSNIQS